MHGDHFIVRQPIEVLLHEGLTLFLNECVYLPSIGFFTYATSYKAGLTPLKLLSSNWMTLPETCQAYIDDRTAPFNSRRSKTFPPSADTRG